MAVRFLSPEWAAAMTQALDSSPEFTSAAAGHEARVQQVVTDAPQGTAQYFFVLENGSAEVGLGTLERADATVTQSYDTAAAISRRELGPQQAFIQGRLRIEGNVMKLMQLQGVLSALGRAVADLDIDYGTS